MKTFSFIILILTLTACTQETDTLKAENSKLKRTNDSLLTELQLNRGVPFIDYHDFEGELGKEHQVHFLAVRKGGYILDSLEIEGYSSDQAESLYDIKSDKFGSLLKFNPDTAGIYSFKTYTRLENDDHTVVQNFKVKIKTVPNNK
jgi:hypothetical protein